MCSVERRISMAYIGTIDWKKLKSDVGRGLEKGMVAAKKGAIVAGKKAEELTDEGRRQVRIMVLKSKVHNGISELGARVYALTGRRSRNPMLDAKVKDMVTKIRKYEAEITSLEKKRRATPRKKAA
jgi:hypothetical protein